MVQLLVFALILVGVFLLGLGLALGGGDAIKLPPASWMMASGGLGMAAINFRRLIREWIDDARLRRARQHESALAASQTPYLFGEYTPYVVEAAEKLGEARDKTAVPAMLRALEHCADTQRPGWSERAEALAHSLGRIGDRRSLPVLYKLENVRGIGFISAIRSAIAAIEPQTSLLRPGSADYPPEMLLRPAHGQNAEEPSILLRSTPHPPTPSPCQGEEEKQHFN